MLNRQRGAVKLGASSSRSVSIVTASSRAWAQPAKTESIVIAVDSMIAVWVAHRSSRDAGGSEITPTVDKTDPAFRSVPEWRCCPETFKLRHYPIATQLDPVREAQETPPRRDRGAAVGRRIQ